MNPTGNGELHATFILALFAGTKADVIGRLHRLRSPPSHLDVRCKRNLPRPALLTEEIGRCPRPPAGGRDSSHGVGPGRGAGEPPLIFRFNCPRLPEGKLASRLFYSRYRATDVPAQVFLGGCYWRPMIPFEPM